MILEEIEKIDLSEKSLKKFGITFCIIFLVISGILYLKNLDIYYYFLVVSFLLLVISFVNVKILKPVYKACITFSIILGIISTNIILTATFFLIITPLGLILRLMGKDLLDIKINKDKKSYWNYRNQIDYKKEYSERQY